MTLVINAYTLKFLNREKISDDTYSFFFSCPENFTFQPGQYLKIKLDIDDSDARGNSRYFTISSTPGDKTITITTRVIKSAFKKGMFNLKKGAEITARGPYGSFVIDWNEKRHQILISLGTGITPFRSMIVYSCKEKLGIKLHLLAFFTDPKNIIFREELTDLARKNENISVQFLNNHNNDEIRTIVKEYVEKFNECVYYIAGAESFVDRVVTFLRIAGVDTEFIHAEDFPGYTK